MLILACVVIAIVVPGIRWRLQIIYLDLLGRIPDLEIRELPALLLPGAGQPKIARLVVTHNPYAVIHVPERTRRRTSKPVRHSFASNAPTVIRRMAVAAPVHRRCLGVNFVMAIPNGRCIGRFAMVCRTPGWRHIRWVTAGCGCWWPTSAPSECRQTVSPSPPKRAPDAADPAFL